MFMPSVNSCSRENQATANWRWASGTKISTTRHSGQRMRHLSRKLSSAVESVIGKTCAAEQAPLYKELGQLAGSSSSAGESSSTSAPHSTGLS